jgi:hypothetical protein
MPACLISAQPILKHMLALFFKDRSACLTTQKRLASLDRKKRDKEQAQVLVYSLKM